MTWVSPRPSPWTSTSLIASRPALVRSRADKPNRPRLADAASLHEEPRDRHRALSPSRPARPMSGWAADEARLPRRGFLSSFGEQPKREGQFEDEHGQPYDPRR